MAKVNTNVPTNPSALAVGFLMLLGSVLGCVFTLVFSDQFQMSTKLRNWRENQMSVQSLRTLQHGVVTIKADRLAKETRILCWILTQPKAHYTKAVHVKNTWGKRCDKLIFMSTKKDEKLGAVALNTSEGYYNLWGKTKAAFRYVYEHHLDEYDWFLKADDDTYTIMENMRYMLCSYDPKYPIYFGSKFRRFYKEGFLGGGSGYVLSREATRKLVEEAMSNKTKCKAGEQGLEDVELAACLLKVGVLIGDSRDSLGRGRFFPLGPDIHIMGQTPKWYKKYAFYKPHLGLQGCSETAIAFHRVPPEHMYWYDFLLYYVRAYGVKHEQPFPPQLPPDRKCIPQEILEKFGQTKNSSIV
ncbi:glycoprotein-N-acetylgalactosamine 3-beta-galactosyltransferase 1-like isoform X2 [Penaeus chinensis]|uniref:glycoprotein-N-acetylgalactosamine 3-beta-galactosyltransferase 1-like isoform X2 n=1 Tax=Penaeus chinensis TaxID=139456 RepID=UPI001FB7D1E8|nr:glycoprotein-N-acetylgalactosamine 3-beta-galactosyltransferase 1-like isoform X2 [Penaeus chinensis]